MPGARQAPPLTGAAQRLAFLAITPARPARSAVPGATEESIAPLPGAEPLSTRTNIPGGADAVRRGAAGDASDLPAGREDARESLPPPRNAPGAAPPAMPAAPTEKREGGKAAPADNEDLFNLDDMPQKNPWRSFTSAARR